MHQEVMEIVEDDYDEEAVDDDDDDAQMMQDGLIIRDHRRAGGPAFDIINLNVNQPERHHNQMIFGRPPRPDRPAGGDWSQLEMEVQAILGNFRNNMPDVVAAPPHHHHGMDDDFNDFLIGRRGPPGGDRQR
jgi:hypothetical protein